MADGRQRRALSHARPVAVRLTWTRRAGAHLDDRHLRDRHWRPADRAWFPRQGDPRADGEFRSRSGTVARAASRSTTTASPETTAGRGLGAQAGWNPSTPFPARIP